MVTGVDFVSIPTRDFDAAFAFYESVLELPCRKRYGRFPGAEFQAGNLTLQIMDSASIGIEFSPLSLPVALHVDDVPSARSELESRGVAFRGETIDSGVCLMAPFSDPDGNVLMLHCRYAPDDAD
jgi:predicted enzyme related to lactoylglutathione lyase